MSTPTKQCTKCGEFKQANKEKGRVFRAKYRARKAAALHPLRDDQKIEAIYADSQSLSELTGIEFEVDHYIPISRGGSHHEDNLQLMPARLNNSKGNTMPIGPALSTQVKPDHHWGMKL